MNGKNEYEWLRIVECKVITHECEGSSFLPCAYSSQGTAIISYPLFRSQSLFCGHLGVPKTLPVGLKRSNYFQNNAKTFAFFMVLSFELTMRM